MAATSSLLNRGLGLVLVEFEYEYEGRDGEMVSIKPNERYILLAKTNAHWWQVRKDAASKPFYIPAKYVKELPPDFPSPLDFADPPSPEPVLLPVAAPVPVPVPVPKPLEESGGSRTKAGDEVTIRLRPDAASRHHKNENRMSTFGVPLDFHDPAPWRPSSPPAAADTGAPAPGETTNTGDGKKPAHPDDPGDSGKSRVPSFSPADPVSTPPRLNLPIPVETPVVPPLNNTEPAGRHDDKKSAMEEEVAEEEEEEEVAEEETSSEDGAEDNHNHIYESIQDLNLDLDALIGGRESPGAPPASAPAPPPTQVVTSPIYANVSPLKKTLHLSVPGPALPSPPPSDPAPPIGHTSSTSGSSSGMLSPASPVSPQDGWQVHTDQDSGKVFYYHPLTRQTTWSEPHRTPEQNQTRGPLGSPLLSPASSQGSCVWEQLVDEISGRFYYYNHETRVTSWSLPESPSSPPGSIRDIGPPPLPEEDYPVENDSNVFTPNPQQHVGVIPRAQLDPTKDPIGSQWRQQELLHLPQRMMGNGVSEEGPALQIKNWRHSVAEDTFTLSHRRNFSDVTEVSNRRLSPDSQQFDRNRLKRNLSDRSTGSNHSLLLEKAGILNKTKVADNGKKIRKNWSQSWTVLHGGILTFHKDPKSAPAGNASKASQIVPEYTVELRGSSISWASKDKSSKKNVLELKTRQGCEYLMQYDTESIICDWLKVIQDTIRQLELDHLSEDEDEASDKEDKDRKRTSTRSSSGDSEQRRVRTKLRRFLQRRPTLQSVKEKGYIRDNVFGCHLDTLCHRENSTIPKFVEKCIRTVERRGLDVDGIYRVSGNLAVIQKLRHKADHEEQLDLEEWEEIHVITGALKLFLRELPEPLFPFSCFDKFIAAIQVSDYTLRVSYMKDLVRTLPLPNHDTMELLFKHLRKVIEHKESNRMSVQSVAIVFGPTLLRPQTESANMTIHMVFQSQIVELMLNEFQTIFSES